MRARSSEGKPAPVIISSLAVCLLAAIIKILRGVFDKIHPSLIAMCNARLWNNSVLQKGDNKTI